MIECLLMGKKIRKFKLYLFKEKNKFITYICRNVEKLNVFKKW